MKFLCSLLLIFVILGTACDSNTSSTRTSPPEIQFESSGEFRYRKVDQLGLPNPVGYVNDFDSVLTASEEKVLDSLLDAFEKETTVEIAYVTIDTTMLRNLDMFNFTLNLAKAWGVGKKDKSNGVLIGLCHQLQAFRIQNGFGIERLLTNAETQAIIDSSFYPSFRKGKIFEGSYTGLQALTGTLRQKINRTN